MIHYPTYRQHNRRNNKLVVLNSKVFLNGGTHSSAIAGEQRESAILRAASRAIFAHAGLHGKINLVETPGEDTKVKQSKPENTITHPSGSQPPCVPLPPVLSFWPSNAGTQDKRQQYKQPQLQAL